MKLLISAIVVMFGLMAVEVCLAASFPEKTPEELVNRLFLSPSTDRAEKGQVLDALNRQYAAVGKQTVEILAVQGGGTNNTMVYLSPLHCAIMIASSWGLVETEDLLLDMVDFRLEPSSLPPGMMVSGSSFLPAAEALVRLRVSSTKLLRAMEEQEESRMPALLWVLIRTQGKEGAIALLSHRISDEDLSSPCLRKALSLVEEIESDSELLSAVMKELDN